MDYEKKYKEALGWMQSLYNGLHGKTKEEAERYFPELKESEDERIRKALISVFSNREKYLIDQSFGDITVSEALAWLEKQGKKSNIHQDTEDDLRRQSTIQVLEYARSLDAYNQYGKESINKDIAWLENQGKTSWKPSKEEMDVLYGLSYITNEFDERKEEVIIRLYQDLKRVFFNGASFENMFPTNTSTELEKQDEQKPGDKVEPKFKVGDWCIDNEDGTIFQIVKVLDNSYIYKTNEGKEYSCSHYSLEIDAKLWTIQDAKDGDVLANNGNIILFKEISNSARKDYKYIQSHCLILAHSSDFYTGGSYNLDDRFHPATKEQRDALMKAIADAGYEWDFEVKEFNKIEKKPAWGEEEKQLLLKDLCARLPYNVKIEANVCPRTLFPMDVVMDNLPKPYLRPMSSMTEEELNECVCQSGIEDIECPNWQYLPKEKQFEARLNHAIAVFLTECNDVDWLNAHHFDYRGLIGMGLALEAPEGMYKTKTV